MAEDRDDGFPLGAFLEMLVLDPDGVAPERIPEVYAALESRGLEGLTDDELGWAQALLATREEEALHHLGADAWFRLAGGLGDAIALGELPEGVVPATAPPPVELPGATTDFVKGAEEMTHQPITGRWNLGLGGIAVVAGVALGITTLDLGAPGALQDLAGAGKAERLLAPVSSTLRDTNRPSPEPLHQRPPTTAVRATDVPSSPGAAGPPESPITMRDPNGQDLVLEDLDVRVAAHGPLALTEIEMVFRNPASRVVEGRFGYVLPPGATISRFAKEVGGRLMEGEVVERLKATRVYTEILHTTRDPALLQQDQGNRFSARVFPIAAGERVRLVLSYSDRNPVEPDGTRTLTVPLHGLSTIGRFRFRAVCRPLPGEEVRVEGWFGSRLERSTSGKEVVFAAADALEDLTPAEDVTLRFEARRDAARSHMLEAGDFRMVTFRPDVDAGVAAAEPEEWVLAVDTSASAAVSGQHRLAALGELAGHLAPGGAGLRVLGIDMTTRELGVASSGSDWARRVVDLVGARRFVGGTNLELAARALGETARADTRRRTFVLVTDGIPTFGSRDAGELARALGAWPSHARLHVLVVGPTRDARVVEALAEAGGGRVVSLPLTTAFAAHAGAAAGELRRAPGANFTVEGEGVEWIEPRRFEDVRRGSELVFFLREQPGVEPTLRVAEDGAGPSALVPTKVEVEDFGPLLEREAYRGLLALLERREAASTSAPERRRLREERLRISVEHRVLCPLTALLVLETEADYRRYDIDRRALADILVVGKGGIEWKRRQRAEAKPKHAPARDKPLADQKALAEKKDNRASETAPALLKNKQEAASNNEALLEQNRRVPEGDADEFPATTEEEEPAAFPGDAGDDLGGGDLGDGLGFSSSDADADGGESTEGGRSMAPGFGGRAAGLDPSTTVSTGAESRASGPRASGNTRVAAIVSRPREDQAPPSDEQMEEYSRQIGQLLGERDAAVADGNAAPVLESPPAPRPAAPPPPAPPPPPEPYPEPVSVADAPAPDLAEEPAAAPLRELSRSYVDRLTRMTPDEHERLERSLSEFTPRHDPASHATLLDQEITQESYHQIRANASGWAQDLFARTGEEIFVPEQRRELRQELEYLKSLYYVNPPRAYERLAAVIRLLTQADPRTRRDDLPAVTTRPPPPPPPPPAPPRPGWVRQADERPTASRLASLREAVRRDPRDRAGWNLLCWNLARAEAWEELRTEALAWQPYDPRNPMVYEYLGEAAAALEDLDEAVRAFGSIAEIAPGDSGLLNRAGFLAMKAGRPDLAVELLGFAIERRPEHANNYRGLALARWMQGDHRAAVEVLRGGLGRRYHSRYKDVHRILREEAGMILRAWRDAGGAKPGEVARIAGELGVGLDRHDALRVTLHWETDANDVDLHGVDPRAGHCYYSAKRVPSGMNLYQDLTQGLGPETMVVPPGKLLAGPYDFGVKYFRAGPMGVSRGVVVIHHPARDGRPEVRIEPFTLLPDAAGGQDMRHVARIEVGR